MVFGLSADAVAVVAAASAAVLEAPCLIAALATSLRPSTGRTGSATGAGGRRRARAMRQPQRPEYLGGTCAWTLRSVRNDGPDRRTRRSLRGPVLRESLLTTRLAVGRASTHHVTTRGSRGGGRGVTVESHTYMRYSDRRFPGRLLVHAYPQQDTDIPMGLGVRVQLHGGDNPRRHIFRSPTSPTHWIRDVR